ncbi:hypothetical protein FACS1894159_04530 [Bacteroidia bacterium]|nr:hypothetical protein FACS1894159_04530 [Bacteroidia bacterium]
MEKMKKIVGCALCLLALPVMAACGSKSKLSTPSGGGGGNTQQPGSGDEGREAGNGNPGAKRATATIAWPAEAGPIVWGYDLKQPESAKGFTNAMARSVLIDDGMTIVRVPIFLNSFDPTTHKIIPTETRTATALAAAKEAMKVRPGVKVFASLKLDNDNGRTTFPEWAYNAQLKRVRTDVYADMLTEYLLYMKNNGVPVHYLAIDNEPEYTASGIQGSTYSMYIDILDGVRRKTASLGVDMPTQFVAPECYGPKQEYIDLVANVISADRGDLITILGTHYYPLYRNANLLGRLKKLVEAGQGRPLWNTEAHYDALSEAQIAKGWNEMDRANLFMVATFDGFDQGCNGMFFWAYKRDESNAKGSLSRKLVQTTVGATHAAIDINSGKDAVDRGFNIRAFVRDRSVAVWIANTDSQVKDYTIEVAGHKLGSDASYSIWNDAVWNRKPYTQVAGSVVVAGDVATITIPARSISLVEFSLQ